MKNYNKIYLLKTKILLYRSSYMRLIIGLLSSLIIDKQDKQLCQLERIIPNCLMPGEI